MTSPPPPPPPPPRSGLPVRLRHLSSLGFSYLVDFDPDYPLTKEQALIVGKASATFEQADNFKMETIGLDPGDAKPKFDKVNTLRGLGGGEVEGERE